MAAAWIRAVAIALVFPVLAPSSLAAQPQPTDHLIQFYQARAARDPDDFLNYNRLGAAYIQKARETGDVTYHELAEQAFRKSLALVGDGASAAAATTSLAAVQIARHRFSDAASLAERALRLAPDDVGALALLGDAHVEVGEYEKAAAAYAGLSTLSAPALTRPRLAYLQFLRGDPAGAISHMRAAVEAAAKRDVPRETLAWSQAELGELFFHVGDLAAAASRFTEALAAFPAYHRGRAGLAKVRAAQKRYTEAAELYQKALAVIPLPEYAAALGDVYTRLGRAADARRQYDLAEYAARLNTPGGSLYSRELALFYADHDLKLDEALALAQKELDLRRDIYTWDVLAWALVKNGRPREALNAMREALRLGTRDARLFFHAGVIHHRLGDRNAAREYLRKARALNPRFHVLLADEAERLLRELGPAER